MVNAFIVGSAIGSTWFFMGYVRVRGIVANSLDHNLRMELDFLVDTRAIYTVITRDVAEKLKLKELSRRKFKTGCGVVELPISEAHVSINGEGVTSLIAVADAGMPLLLGVTTLELLSLQVDPVSGELKPLDLLIM